MRGLGARVRLRRHQRVEAPLSPGDPPSGRIYVGRAFRFFTTSQSHSRWAIGAPVSFANGRRALERGRRHGFAVIDADDVVRTPSAAFASHVFGARRDAWCNLHHRRGLERHGWKLTQIPRIDVRDAMTRDLFTRDDYIFDAPPFDSCGAADYPAEPSFTDLGLEELEDRDISIEIGDVEIPF